MSDSLLLAVSRSNDLHIVDPDVIPHSEDLSPLMQLLAELIKRGYKGVAVVERQLKNGRFIQAMDFDNSTPEGQVISKLVFAQDQGRQLPEVKVVLEAIQHLYKSREYTSPSNQSKTEKG